MTTEGDLLWLKDVPGQGKLLMVLYLSDIEGMEDYREEAFIGVPVFFGQGDLREGDIVVGGAETSMLRPLKVLGRWVSPIAKIYIGDRAGDVSRPAMDIVKRILSGEKDEPKLAESTAQDDHSLEWLGSYLNCAAPRKAENDW